LPSNDGCLPRHRDPLAGYMSRYCAIHCQPHRKPRCRAISRALQEFSGDTKCSPESTVWGFRPSALRDWMPWAPSDRRSYQDRNPQTEFFQGWNQKTDSTPLMVRALLGRCEDRGTSGTPTGTRSTHGWQWKGYPMSGFPDCPNPIRSGAMQCATGATIGRIFRHI
jgi:hypothetical protein